MPDKKNQKANWDPYWVIEDEWGSTDPNSFILKSTGEPARNLEIIIGTDERGWPKPPPLLDKDEICPVHISNLFLSFDLFEFDTAAPPSNDQSSYCRVGFISERHERFEQRWAAFRGRGHGVRGRARQTE